MAEARSRLEWAQTSSLLALLYNVHRKPGSRALKPADFDPHAGAGKEAAPAPADTTLLQSFFPGAREWKMAGR